jgi:hypothetical protein
MTSQEVEVCVRMHVLVYQASLTELGQMSEFI